MDFEVRFKNPGLLMRLFKVTLMNIPMVKRAMAEADEIQEAHRKTILNQESIIEDRSREIETMHRQLLDRERLMTEINIAGGMAHEIRNTLGAAKLRLGDRQSGRLLEESNQCLLKLFREFNRCGDETTAEEKKQLLTIFRSLSAHHTAISKTIGEIDRAVARGLTVTNRVAAYAGFQAEPSYDRIDPAAIVRTLCETYEEGFLGHGITIERTIQKDLCCLGNGQQIHSILQNLLLNARDAIVETGRASGAIAIRAWLENGECLIEISDNGIGVPDDIREKIFRPFFSTKSKHGMGLGLNESLKMIAALKGRIEMESCNGTGTTFRVFLPANGLV